MAIDSVGADFLNNGPTATLRRPTSPMKTTCTKQDLSERSPSRTQYTDGNGNADANLGVHEHWNNAAQKQYSRNLGKPEGIELVQIHE